MKTSISTAALTLLLSTQSSVSFSFIPSGRLSQCRTSTSRVRRTQLKMGIFDLFKDAFSAPALDQSAIDSERETPIDRWMGWSTKAIDEQGTEKTESRITSNFVDSMSEANYIKVKLSKPMGIVFEENDDDFGGIFVLSLKEGGIAEKDGQLKPGDQLVAVDSTKVSGESFDTALGTIIENENESISLVVFRGAADQLYGPTGASKEWLTEFISGAKVPAATS
mmetsp:Transcript_12459/g.15607  ORF Transcript_12459/g.15607 Transcript_12459/m.15607 type:complete len:223 (+) Transcript_12459:170-838(+)|eukprot:CAMPEP_0172494638 /NCGR_PEP_ID=MMETSP1066-20121228/51763_1 /TAXON_ID=671091 /ORGANISM="Coscinodiscus wailesii, Strain CCMP2513" /LENGTH=222 /DNA_ID=CAMNT_0013265759 /DNA_START=170 /DNA_END=841 /DNA_ORIENTATION=+